MSNLINIKGGRDGLRMRFDDTAEWSSLLTHLGHQLTQNRAFFNGARLTLDMGERAVSEAQLAELLSLMQQHGVSTTALNANDREARSAARAIGITARPVPTPRELQTASNPSGADGDALLLVRTVRSGQLLRHSGHITLVGDVNPGGEVIAGGSIVVWGRLRGLVHAGALGNEEALVCALELRPTQIRIANQLATTPPVNGPHVPEIARIEGDQIIVTPWEAYKK
jgi:septum site-determining protein MinC